MTHSCDTSDSTPTLDTHPRQTRDTDTCVSRVSRHLTHTRHSRGVTCVARVCVSRVARVCVSRVASVSGVSRHLTQCRASVSRLFATLATCDTHTRHCANCLQTPEKLATRDTHTRHGHSTHTLDILIERTPPPPGGFPIYYVPSSRTVSKRTPLEEPGTNSSRGVLLLTVLDEGT